MTSTQKSKDIKVELLSIENSVPECMFNLRFKVSCGNTKYGRNILCQLSYGRIGVYGFRTTPVHIQQAINDTLRQMIPSIEILYYPTHISNEYSIVTKHLKKPDILMLKLKYNIESTYEERYDQKNNTV